ncbi:MAG: hypothetical protein A2Y40_05590 [Candidatus Margulisbacteria bacterium GWF2_35_9]|nr:MAG: hypothetical protein A2Y40_05590 [Candidatus Margulisbacteria bacterium GWF2_35_9]
MTKDPLFFISEPTANITGNISSSGNFSINPFSFILNTLIVILLIYIVVYILKHLFKVKSSDNSYLLKEIPINASLKILFITIGKKLYILANNTTQLILMDTIKDQKEILSILTKQEESNISRPPSIFSFLNIKKKSKIEEKFESTLKNIINNSNTLEDLNKK